MKKKAITLFRPLAIAAVGVFLGRAAQADTILDFDLVPPGQVVNGPPGVSQTFGDFAAATSDGVTVSGFGTPNIDLSWKATGAGDARWDYYNDAGVYDFWMLGQLNDSEVGVNHSITFAPNNASVRAVIKSFNFFPYYNSSERFTYDVSVTAGSTVVNGPTQFSYLSDATKNHPVSINYTGAPGQILKLNIVRVASTLGTGEEEGGAYNIGVDDIRFAQTPESVFPAGPVVIAVTPEDGTTGVPASYYPYQASITNGTTTVVASSIQLRLDGNLVAATISSGAGVTNVNYLGTALLPSGSTHTYRLTYDDSGGATYTNDAVFTVARYTTLPTAYALPPTAGQTRGLTFRTVLVDPGANTLPGTVARAEAQLAGTLINPDTSQPYPNLAPLGTNADGSYSIDTVINFEDGGSGAAGDFPGDVTFPGLDLYPNNWFACEGLLHVELTPGYYRFGVNSDDGFQVTAIPPQGVAGSPIVLGAYDANRGAADTLFDLLVQSAGLYPFRLVYFESTGSASCELFSADIVTGTKVLVNDPADPNAIRSYRVLKPMITSVTRNGQNLDIQWSYGTPPFQVQFKTDLNNPTWTDIGSPTANRTATIAIQPGTGFIRVVGQP